MFTLFMMMMMIFFSMRFFGFMMMMMMMMVVVVVINFAYKNSLRCSCSRINHGICCQNARNQMSMITTVNTHIKKSTWWTRKFIFDFIWRNAKHTTKKACAVFSWEKSIFKAFEIFVLK